jgi:predicted TIM-barrel fold metal-dependent hydrolase
MAGAIEMVSADGHAEEPDSLWEKVPAKLRDRMPPARVKAKRPAGGADSKLRLPDMDADGLRAEVLYPDTALGFFGLEPDVQAYSFRLYNDWIAEFCSVAPKRLFGVPALAVYDIDGAIKELGRAKDLGLVGALVWEVPDPKLPFTSDHYEKLWAAAAEMDMPVNFHISTGHNYLMNKSGFREDPDGIELARAAVNHKTAAAVNAVFDMIWSGVFERHPKLKLVLVESEVGWLPFILQQWDYYYTRFSKPGLRQQKFPISRLPSEIFFDHIYCTFVDDFAGSRALTWWGERNCMWSSDYPHSNMTFPKSREVVAKHFGDMPEAKRRRLVRDNVVELYGLNI